MIITHFKFYAKRMHKNFEEKKSLKNFIQIDINNRNLKAFWSLWKKKILKITRSKLLSSISHSGYTRGYFFSLHIYNKRSLKYIQN